ncbi:MAG: ATP-dependent RecD-like DNA helicase [Desulfovibrionaceae bacterium]|nr:ATP-dependent RecD-like DNA helicase [Desulfovibrionaceae bacterium]
MATAEKKAATLTQNLEEIEGEIAKINFHQPDNGYTVLKLSPTSKKKKRKKLNEEPPEEITCVGTSVEPKIGSHLKLYGVWGSHPKYGRQFKFTSYEEVLPTTNSALVDYLCSGYIKGVQKILAKRIVKKFGTNTLEILDNEPERLLEIEGIGSETCNMIISSWNEHKISRELILFLKPLGFSMAIRAAILRIFEGNALDVIKENPYRLALDVPGVSFTMADNLGRFLEFPDDHPLRREAYIISCLKDATHKGHVYLPKDKLAMEANRFLNCTALEFEDLLNRLLAQKRIVVEQKSDWQQELLTTDDQGFSGDFDDNMAEAAIYLPPYYSFEVQTARAIHRILNAPKSVHIHNPEALANVVIAKQDIELAKEQSEAVKMAAKAKILILTGGPGTGKTTTINTIIDLFKTQNAKISLAAPTGRAAKRMYETTKQEAKTIHRILEYSPQTQAFTRTNDNPLDCDLLIVDEASMLDIALAAHLFLAIPDGCTLVLVGDICQLPSVGPGSVLSDIINSQMVPIVRLTQIFRQSAESAIVRNAHLINSGQVPPVNEKNSDFFFLFEDDPEKSAQTIADLVARRLPTHYHFNILNDIQVLSPMHKGELGITKLNKLLQEKLNPNNTQVSRGDHIYRLNDKVMQIHNDYVKDVFNGDLGIISSMDLEKQILSITFDEDKIISYKFDELDDIVPAYAISIHKSQGSEYPCVIIPMSMSHSWMLERNLIYTGVTRGKKLVVLIGQQSAFARAVRNNTMRKRFSRLWLRLARLKNTPDMPNLDLRDNPEYDDYEDFDDYVAF